MVAMNVWPTDAADGSVATEARWRKMGRMWAPSGVSRGVGGEMASTLAGVNLTVKAGACWVDGAFCELPGDQVLATTANGLTVVRFDPAANTAQLLYRDAITTPAQDPAGTYELPISQIVGSAVRDRRRFNDQNRGATMNRGSLGSGDLNFTTGGIRDMIGASLGPAPYPVFVEVSAICYFGFSSGWVNAAGDIYSFSLGGVAGQAPIHQCVTPNVWSSFPIGASWAVPVNADMGFKLRYNLSQSQGSGSWANMNCTFRVYVDTL